MFPANLGVIGHIDSFTQHKQTCNVKDRLTRSFPIPLERLPYPLVPELIVRVHANSTFACVFR